MEAVWIQRYVLVCERQISPTRLSRPSDEVNEKCEKAPEAAVLQYQFFGEEVAGVLDIVRVDQVHHHSWQRRGHETDIPTRH